MDELEANRNKSMTMKRTGQITLDGRITETRCHCGKICKNARGLKIHQSGFGTNECTVIAETQEEPILDTHRSKEP